MALGKTTNAPSQRSIGIMRSHAFHPGARRAERSETAEVAIAACMNQNRRAVRELRVFHVGNQLVNRSRHLRRNGLEYLKLWLALREAGWIAHLLRLQQF